MIFLIMGPPGAGKGTQAAKIIQEFGLVSISTGQMFRDAYQKGHSVGIAAMEYIKHGQLVPDDVTNQMVRERLEELDSIDNFILDGYPRTVDQAIALDEMLKVYGKKLDAVINIDVEKEELFNRMENRRMCEDCGTTYHLTFKPPKIVGICDLCGGIIQQRKDDSHKSVKKRLEVYELKTKPLLEYYEGEQILYHIDGMNGFEGVYQQIKEIVKIL
jgi:adenylate kinase